MQRQRDRQMRRLLLTADRVESRSAVIAAVAFLISGSSRSRGCTRRCRRDDRRRDPGRWIPSPHFPRFARHAISVRRERQARVESSFTDVVASVHSSRAWLQEREKDARQREVIREHEHGMRDQERKRGRKSVAEAAEHARSSSMWVHVFERQRQGAGIIITLITPSEPPSPSQAATSA